MESTTWSADRSPTITRFLVLAWLCLLATLAYIHRGCISVPATLVQEEFCLTEVQLGYVMSAFFLAYAIFQIPSGWIGDRWGTRRVLTVLILLWSLATEWMGMVGGFLGLWLSRFVSGAAQAGIFPCSVNTVSKWFPPSGKAFPNGMLGSFMSVGAVAGAFLTGRLLYYFDWQEVFVLLSVPGVVIAVGFYVWFRDRPAEHSWVNSAELRLIEEERAEATADSTSNEEEAEQVTASTEPADSLPWMTMISSPQMILICAQQFFRAAGYIFYLTWFPRFLQTTRNVSVEESGELTSIPLLGIVIGSAMGGLVMDWIFRVTGSRRWSRQGVAVASMLGCAVCVCAAYFTYNPLVMAIILATGSLSAGFCGPAGYTITIDLGGRYVATVFSTMNMMGNIGAFLLPLVVVPFAKMYSWNETLLLIAGLYVAAAVCWAMIDVNRSIF